MKDRKKKSLFSPSLLVLSGFVFLLTSSPALTRSSNPDNVSAPEHKIIRESDSTSQTSMKNTSNDRNFLTPLKEYKQRNPDRFLQKKITDKSKNTVTDSQQAAEGKVAELSVMGGGYLKQSHSGQALKALTGSYITSQLNAAAQEAFTPYGTVEVNLSTNEQFSFRNSSFDMFLPLHDGADHIIFTQGGLRRFDERTQANLGFGFRSYQPDWFYGSNVFVDRDISQKHLRGSIGLEAGTDFFKANVNRYQRLSGWRDTDYSLDLESRPASGWDLITEGWFPAYPQLGGMLKYEKYHGQNVALLSREQLQHNPRALTAGLSWTPVPLATLNAQRRHGNNGKRDTVVGLELRYQYGMPLKAQLDPHKVHELRKMQGSRYDLVQRNNNIVLEYRKKQVISISATPTVTGISGETRPLSLTVKSKYGLDKILWDAVSFSENGGQITENSKNNFSLRMPLWKNGKQEVNTYSLSATAVDIKGNVSSGTRIKIIVKPAAVSQEHSFITPDNYQSPADGKTIVPFTLKLLDERKNPVDLPEEQISGGFKVNRESADCTSESDGSVRIKSIKRTDPGVYAIRLIAGKKPGKYLLLARAGEAEIKSAVLVLTRENSAESLITVKLAGNETVKPADGKNTFDYTVNITNKQNLPRKGIRVFTRVDKQGVSVSENVMTDENGRANFQLKSGQKPVEDITVYAGDDEKNMVAADRKVSFIADRQNAFISKLEIISDNALADGQSKDSLNAYVEDKNGNLVQGASVRFTAGKGLMINGHESEVHVMTDNKGLAKVDLTTKRAGSYNIRAEVEQSSMHITKETSVSFSEVKLPFYNAEISSDRYDLPADGVSSARIRVKVSDPNGENAVGLKDRMAFRLKSQTTGHAENEVTMTKIIESEPGIYSVSITSANALKVDITPELNDVELHVKTITINFQPLSAVAERSTIRVDKTSYQLGENANVIVRLRNHENAPVRNAVNEVKESIYIMGALKDNWTEKENGVYQASFKTNATGNAQAATLKLKDWSEEVRSENYTVYGIPRVDDVRIKGTGLAGHRLETQLIGFNSNYTGVEDSEYTWQFQSSDRSWIKIANQKNITPPESAEGFNYRVCVIPKGKDQPVKGEQKCSKPVKVFTAAAITSVDISGSGVTGDTLKSSTGVKESIAQTISVKYQWYYRSGNNWNKISSNDSSGTSWKIRRDYPGYEVKLVATPYGSLSGIGESKTSRSLLIKSRTPATHYNWIKPKLSGGCWWNGDDEIRWELPGNSPNDLSAKIYRADGMSWILLSTTAAKNKSVKFSLGGSTSYRVLFIDKFGNLSGSTMIGVNRPIIGNCSISVVDNPSSAGRWID